uniref:alpha/beta hydrolase n=1 Tax=Altererythrobacter segetis TaxID=1104773 RepID=UPI001FAF44B7|nr:alpha/beta hydrolase [Altererythrobacter segetis]
MAFDRRAIPPHARESRWSAPDGYAIRRIDWSQAGNQPRGSLLFLPGRGDAYEKYLETLAHWQAQGWCVTALDWRGQAGSGRLGADAVTGHVDDFAHWVADLAAFWREWAAERPGPHVLAGHSMGGHLALRAVAEGAVRPDALILSAPMLGFLPAWLPGPVQNLAARLMCRVGDPRRPAWKWSEKPGEVPEGRAKLLTHDATRYADELWWRQKRPELAMGPGSWGWVGAALASMAALYRPGALEAVDVPVLLLSVSGDALVSAPAIARAAARLPRSEQVVFGAEAYHEVLREADPVRERALAAIDEFLARVLAG